jgi:hypothetical protein
MKALQVSDSFENAEGTTTGGRFDLRQKYWQVTSFPRMRSPNSIDFIIGD